MIKGIKKALSLLMSMGMAAGLFVNVPMSVVRAEEGGVNSEAGIYVEGLDENIEDGGTYLMAADWVEWGECGPDSLSADEDGNWHYKYKWVTSFGDTHPVKLALVTAHAVEEGQDGWEWSLDVEAEVSMNSIRVKDSDGNVIESGDEVQYGTWGSFSDDEMDKDNPWATFLFLGEDNYKISYTKDGVEYELPVEITAPVLGLYSEGSITADKMLIDEKRYDGENEKGFFAGLSFDEDEVENYRILMEREDGKEDWQYSYCELAGVFTDINEFLTIGEETEAAVSGYKQVIIPLTIKTHVPGSFWMNLAVELTFKDENRNPEVYTWGINVINDGNELLATDWIYWSEDDETFKVVEEAEYSNCWVGGLDSAELIAFRLSNNDEADVKASDLGLFDAEGNELEFAVFENGEAYEEACEEAIREKNKAAVACTLDTEGSVVQVIFLQMGNFYLHYQEAELFVHVGLPELGFYTSQEFSEETYVFSLSPYELRSDAPEKTLYVRLQTGDWHKEIQDTDVNFSVFRDWEHYSKVEWPEEYLEQDEEPVEALENSDYIEGNPEKIDSGEDELIYKVTFKDSVPDSFLLKVQVERTDKETGEDCPLLRFIEVQYVQAPAKLTGIRITNQPLKTTYTVGETFDKTGMVVTADYDDGTTEVITDYEVKPSGSLAAGDKSITISYEGKSATLNIIVKEKTSEAVSETKPAKQKGAEIELDSMKYTVTDANADGTGTVAYAGTADKKAKTIKIPNVITDSETGVSYKVTSIKKNALKNAKALTSVTIGSNVTKIGESAFSSCKKLKKITIPGSVTSIGKNAFKGCTALTTVTIGKKVASIGGSAFNGCKKLKSITIKSTVLKTVGSNAFKGISNKATIKVPKKKKSAYKKLIIQKGKAPTQVKIK